MHASTVDTRDMIEDAPESLEPSDLRAGAALAALGQQSRLRIFRRLMRAEPYGITVGELARALRYPQNTVSGHLAILTRAQLATGVRQGRSMRYRADLDGMRWLLEYLLADCCNGDPWLCAPLLSAAGAVRCPPDVAHGQACGP